MARLLALVADLLPSAGLLRAVPGQMARHAAVVALVPIHAVAFKTIRKSHLHTRFVRDLRDMWPIPPHE